MRILTAALTYIAQQESDMIEARQHGAWELCARTGERLSDAYRALAPHYRDLQDHWVQAHSEET
jgi:hypothetical protein